METPIFIFEKSPDLDLVLELDEEIQDESNVEFARFGFNQAAINLANACPVINCEKNYKVFQGRIIYPCDKLSLRLPEDKVTPKTREVLSRVRAKITLCMEHLIEHIDRFDPDMNARYYAMTLLQKDAKVINLAEARTRLR